MKTSLGFRRNQVVVDTKDPIFPARIWKVLDDGHVIVIDCGLHVKKVHETQLVNTGYKGRWTSNRSITGKTHFLGMSRLRSLLKGARHYNPKLIPEKRD